jgi:threonine-phosphate decarboxylase
MQRLNCERFPCHFLEQDCSLCFCPFYPCRDERTGGKEKDGAWCCDSCRIIHYQEIADMVLDSLLNGEAVSAVWKKLEARLK